MLCDEITELDGILLFWAGSVANFYSPLESLAGSDDEEGEGEENR